MQDRRSERVGTVLVVEDEIALRLSVSKMLRKEGFTVIEAGDGDAAVGLFRDHEADIDVVLLDMTIPGIPSQTVIAAAGRIRPDVKGCSSQARTAGRQWGRRQTQSKSEGFILKPFRLGDLMTLIRETLSG